MPRPPSEEGDIKISPEVHEKRAFIQAASAARQSLNQWAIAAMLKVAKEQGFPADKKGRR